MELSDDDRARPFREHRPLLFSIAYDMLGSIADAEDVVQEAYLRWERADAGAVRSPRDFLCTTVARLALDHLQSARVRRERYVGPWLPDPLVGATEHDPAGGASLAESLSTAFMVLLERLTPLQRAAFLLHEVFGYGYREMAGILGVSEPNGRQLVHRARTRIAGSERHFHADQKQAKELARHFLDACRTGDLEQILGMLEHDAVAWADGGGRVSAARRPVRGAHRVSRFLLAVIGKWMRDGEVRDALVNGSPGLVAYIGGRPWAVVSVDAGASRIRDVYVVVNPDKLRVD